MFISNDRYHGTKSINPNRPVRSFKPRTRSGITQENKLSLYWPYVAPGGVVSWTRLFDSVQTRCTAVRHSTQTHGPRSTHCAVHASESRDAPDSTPVIRRNIHVRTNKRERGSGPCISVRDSICVPEKDFSPILLDNKMIKYLVLGPGATGLFAMLGCLRMLQDTEKLDIKEIAGASSGAILSFLYILMQGDTQKILSESLDADMESNTKVNIRTLFKSYGFIDTQGIKSKLQEICFKICNLQNPTFQELYDKFPIKLHISAFCLEDGKTVYFSKDTHPQVKVLDAIGGSIAVPFLFCAQQIEDKTYVDGGLAEVIPLVPFLDKPGDDVCSLRVLSADTPADTIADIKSFTQRLIQTMLKYRITYENARVINIDLTDVDIFNFKITDKQKIELFVKGYLAH